MKTATVREAQHHLSKLLDEVENGQEIVLTRRGKRVGRLVPMEKVEEPEDRKVDWNAWLKVRDDALKDLPVIKGSAMDAEREGYRW